jgi:hypothetical protein
MAEIPAAEKASQPKSQEKADFRARWPSWMKQLPRTDFPDSPKADFQLIDRQEMHKLLEQKGASAESIKRLDEDLDFMNHELLRLFKERDYKASQQQNLYRLYQIGFMTLAAIATLIGAFQALALNDNPNVVPLLALFETIIALMTTYLATISGREAPLPQWLANRRRAEYLRREYFRFIMDMPPYDVTSGYERRLLLSARAANISRGVYPDKQGEQGGS